MKDKLIEKMEESVKHLSKLLHSFNYEVIDGNSKWVRLESEIAALKAEMEKEEKSFIITVEQRVEDILNLGDNKDSVHDAPIMDRNQNEAIRFLAKQIDHLHKIRIKSKSQ